jgi:hypothetical protein
MNRKSKITCVTLPSGVWSDASRLAGSTGQSLSRLITACLAARLYPPAPTPVTATTAVPPPSVLRDSTAETGSDDDWVAKELGL